MNPSLDRKHIILLVGLAIALSFTRSCQFNSPGTSTSGEKPVVQATLSYEKPDWVDVYFSEPDNPQSQTLRGGPDKYLADAIRRARVSVDIAVLNLDLWSIRDALMDAHRRGVSVRLVTDSDYLDQPEIKDLIKAGIPILSDRREGLMHNKFVIIDRQEVWTGSMNLTINGVYRNDNHLIRIQSTQLAKNYTAEFEEMYLHDLFGPGSPNQTPHPTFTINGIQIENYFSPDDQTEARLIELIQSAQESIYFLAYSFTSDPIADAMLERAADGVLVTGVFESSQYRSNAGTEFDRFTAAGLDMRLDGNPKNMHHKVIIIDQKVVVAGSYNYSFYAETRNDENTLILHDPLIASLFEQEFRRVFEQGSQP
ncbi:MAG TPA: phospholipase D-like domain-containing protein [Anaerolineales bacterium]|nr:phospholipase D-like domain-containing protein [Anaerolineales bacterium]